MTRRQRSSNTHDGSCAGGIELDDVRAKLEEKSNEVAKLYELNADRQKALAKYSQAAATRRETAVRSPAPGLDFAFRAFIFGFLALISGFGP